jgi:hypothetical protein
MKQFILDHATLLSVLGAYVFLGVVSTLPKPGDPRPLGAKLYSSFYAFLNLIANRVAEKEAALNNPMLTRPVRVLDIPPAPVVSSTPAEKLP